MLPPKENITFCRKSINELPYTICLVYTKIFSLIFTVAKVIHLFRNLHLLFGNASVKSTKTSKKVVELIYIIKVRFCWLIMFSTLSTKSILLIFLSLDHNLIHKIKILRDNKSYWSNHNTNPHVCLLWIFMIFVIVDFCEYGDFLFCQKIKHRYFNYFKVSFR